MERDGEREFGRTLNRRRVVSVDFGLGVERGDVEGFVLGAAGFEAAGVDDLRFVGAVVLDFDVLCREVVDDGVDVRPEGEEEAAVEAAGGCGVAPRVDSG